MRFTKTPIFDDKNKKTHGFKTLGATFLVGVMILFNLLLVGSADLSPVPIKSYNPTTQDILLISPDLTKNVADIKLETDWCSSKLISGVNCIPESAITFLPIGYQKIAEFNIDVYDDTYTNPLESIELQNMKEGGKLITRKVDYKVLIDKEILVNDYVKECNAEAEKNGTTLCHNKISGTHIEYITDWVDLDTTKLIKGTYKIGLFMDIYLGDDFDYVPTWFGVKLTEWARVIQSSGTQTFAEYGGLNYTILTYTSNGTFNYSKSTDLLNLSVLVVGGGGGARSGGGGAGGVIFNTTYYVFPNENLTITVGSGGGMNPSADGYGMNGTSSSINGASGTLIAYGGSGGGGVGGNGIMVGTWGSSGGGGAKASAGATIGGRAYTSTQGNIGGGNGNYYGGQYPAGGGGGAGASGGNATGNSNAGTGGAGRLIDINGTATYWGGGGGGCLYSAGGTAGTGGAGGGGAGNSGGAGANATANTGGGGGGNGGDFGQSMGGSGIVIIRYLTSEDFVPQVVYNSPVNYYNTSTNPIIFNISIIDLNTGGAISNVTFSIDGVVNETNTTLMANGTAYIFTKYVSEGTHNYSLLAYNNKSIASSVTTRFFTLDSTSPVITIVNPTNTTYWTNITTVNNISHTYNWTTRDTNRDKCWWSINNGATNNSIVCNANYSFSYPVGSQTFIAWGNDSVGNIGGSRVTATWDFHTFENSRTVPTVVTEGSTQSFIINLTANTSIIGAYLNYNGTRKSVSIAAGDFSILTSSFSIPTVTANGNVTILWEINVGEGYFNSSSSVVNVTNLGIDNCSTNLIKLSEWTIKDEITQTLLDTTLDNDTIYNTSAKVNLQIYPYGSLVNSILNYSSFMNRTNPFAICFNKTLNVGERYSMNMEIEYQSYSNESSHVKEYYHLQNETIDTNYIYENYTLYDLDTTNAQTFRIFYRDNSYNPISNALIVIKRKYVDEGIFKTTEIPLTDYAGGTTASLQKDNVIYSFYIYKYGELLDSFENQFVTCLNAPLGDCTLNLRGEIPPIVVENFSSSHDVVFSIIYNRSSRGLSSVFSTSSGDSSLMVLNGTIMDNVGNNSFNCGTLTSSSGTISCSLPSSLGNGTAVVKLYKDGIEVGTKYISLERTPKEIFGNSQIFLLIFLYLILIGVAISGSPMITGIFLIIGVILGVVLNLVTASGVIGYGATALWFIIAVILVLTKGAKRQ